VASGGTVTWTWSGPGSHSATHNVTSTTGLFESNTQTKGPDFFFTFATPGTYTYECTIHASAQPPMRGTIVVR
jgi:plastocyanin